MAATSKKPVGKRAAKVPTKAPLRAAREQGLAPRTVTQSNELIQAAYSLTLNEMRLVLMAASQIDPRKPPKRNVSIRITAGDFADLFDIKSSGHSYEALADAASRLYERSIRSLAKNKRGEPIEEKRWIAGRATYDDGTVTLQFNESVLPYMTLLSAKFTTYQLRQVSGLSSQYGIRLYQLGAQYKRLGERYIELEVLRDMLDLGEKYANVKDLRRWVIDPSMKEISETSDLQMEAKPVREGRRIVGFLLTMEENPQQALL